MPNILNKTDHLTYAAVHQCKDAYIKAVRIHHTASITKLIIVGGIIYLSKSEFIPVITELIKVMQ